MRRETRYQIQASIDAVDDVDRYALKTPEEFTAGIDWGRMTLEAVDPDLAGEITVFDDQWEPVATTYVVHNDETAILQFGPVVADATYFVEIAAADNSLLDIGNYDFQAQFGVKEIQRETFRSGTIASNLEFDRHRLTVDRPQLFQFRLDAGPALDPTAKLELEIVDRDGNSILTTMTTLSGDSRTMAVFMPRGRYLVLIRAASDSGPFADMDYTLAGATIDDPLGPRIDDTTETAFSFDPRYEFLLAVAIFAH